MSQSLLHSPLLTFMIAVSFFGLFLVVMLATNPLMMQESFPWRKPIIGLVFGLVCVLGIVAVFFPKQCSTSFHLEKGDRKTSSNAYTPASHGSSPTLRGHHPDCEGFSAHTVRIDDKTLCAACTGLLLGALMALAGAVLYFFGDWHIAQNGLPAVFVGTLGVGFGLFQLEFRSFVRLLLNAFFVLGAFYILVGIDKLTQSLFIDLFLVVLIVFWLFTRILLSQWDHWRICYTCESPCEIREKTKKRSVSAAQSIEGANDNKYSKEDYREWPSRHSSRNQLDAGLLQKPYDPPKKDHCADG
ncbi:MAG: hypothetical protein ACE5IF_00170 [Candidatus Bathyarchaeia archaeon]